MSTIADRNQPTENEQEKPHLEEENEDVQIPRWLRWAISRTKKQLTFPGHLSLTASLAFFVLGSYWMLFWFAGTKETEWLGTSPRFQPEVVKTAVSQLSATPAEKARLADQFQEIELRAARHAKIMGFFYKQYYISLSMIVGAAGMASICLFFISKSGWERINNAVINLFISSSAVILFYGNLMFVFKQDENLRGNQELYLSYISLREEVLSYWATRQTNMGEALDPAQFIHYLDNKMQTLNRIQLGFDSPQISTFVDQFKFDESQNNPLLQPSPQQ